MMTGGLRSAASKLASMPLDPASAAMLLFGAEHGDAETAARLALLLQERGLGGRGEDLEARLSRWNADRGQAGGGEPKAG